MAPIGQAGRRKSIAVLLEAVFKTGGKLPKPSRSIWAAGTGAGSRGLPSLSIDVCPGNFAGQRPSLNLENPIQRQTSNYSTMFSKDVPNLNGSEEGSSFRADKDVVPKSGPLRSRGRSKSPPFGGEDLCLLPAAHAPDADLVKHIRVVVEVTDDSPHTSASEHYLLGQDFQQMIRAVPGVRIGGPRRVSIKIGSEDGQSADAVKSGL